MPTRKLPASEWRIYMDRLSRRLPTTRVEIHVTGLDIGDQIGVDRVLLAGITYDAHDRALEIATESFRHVIARPMQITVEEHRGVLRCIEVVDHEGHRQIVSLHPALALPAG